MARLSPEPPTFAAYLPAAPRQFRIPRSFLARAIATTGSLFWAFLPPQPAHGCRLSPGLAAYGWRVGTRLGVASSASAIPVLLIRRGAA